MIFRSVALIISIRAPTRGATRNAVNKLWTTVFQSALPRGERRKDAGDADAPQNFNPRSHEGSDPRPERYILPNYDFNPRSHEGSDRIGGGNTEDSVNFNPRSHEGSDLVLSESNHRTKISIRAPTRGATDAGLPFGVYTGISIRAPTRGATILRNLFPCDS